MRLLVLLLVIGVTRGALVEEGKVRLRYGTPVSNVWADIIFSGITTLPDLEESESYDPYDRSEFVSVETERFQRVRVGFGDPRLSLHPTSELLVGARCITFGPHVLEISKDPCPCTGVPCERGDTLCSYNTTEGKVELFRNRPTLTPEVARKLRFGQRVQLGPIVLEPGQPWLRMSTTSTINALSLESVVYEQVVHIDLATSAVCTEPQSIERHNTWTETGLAFALVLVVAGVSSTGAIQRTAITCAAALLPVPLFMVWVPLRLQLFGASLVYFLPLGSIAVGLCASLYWMVKPSPWLVALVANGAWAALWYQQYQVDATTWDSLSALIVLVAWTWVNIRGQLSFFGIIQSIVLWSILIQRNPLLVTYPTAPATLFVFLGLVFWRSRSRAT